MRFTIGVDISKKTIDIDNIELTLTFFDTAGQEKYQSITRSYYKGAGACLLVYDLTQRQTFEDLEKWRNQLMECVGHEIPIVVIGNKTDIFQQREVATEDGEQYARKHGFFFIETSCSNGNNVNEAIDIIIKQLVQQKQELIETQKGNDGNVSIQKPQLEEEKNGCC